MTLKPVSQLTYYTDKYIGSSHPQSPLAIIKLPRDLTTSCELTLCAMHTVAFVFILLNQANHHSVL